MSNVETQTANVEIPVMENTGSTNSQNVGVNTEESTQITVVNKSAESQSCYSQKSNHDIISFHQEENMLWSSWTKYFESICVENKLDDFWKIRNIHKYLKGKALTLYVNNCLHIMHWDELVELFNQEFLIPGEPTLSDFANIRFQLGNDLNSYYQEKIKLGRNLGLESKFILEGLTEGLPMELRKLVVANAPKNTNDWRELVYKLNKLQVPPKVTEDKRQVETVERNLPFYRQWRPTRFSPEISNQFQPRLGTYRMPFRPDQNRQYTPLVQRNVPQNIRTNRPPIHFQQDLSMPHTPCRLCLNVGILNAYHWMRNCPFQNQNLMLYPNRNPGMNAHPNSIERIPETNPNRQVNEGNIEGATGGGY